MKYVDWADRVWQAAARLADADDDAALFGFDTLALPKELGFEEAASEPGFVGPGGLFEAVMDAISDLRDLAIVQNDDQWRVQISRDLLGSKNTSLATTWHRVVERALLRGEAMTFLRHVAQPGVGVEESERWARRLTLESDPIFEALGWGDFDTTKRWRIMSDLKEQEVINGSGFAGGLWRFDVNYRGIVLVTEPLRFEKQTVSEGAPTCFVSYAHEDKAVARDIAYGLQAADLDIAIDEAELAGGDSLLDWIAETTARVEFVVVLVSEHSADSRWCKYEVALAMTDEVNAAAGQRSSL